MRPLFSLTLIGAVVACAAGTATAGQVTIPNTFVSGTPAKAADVNANFSAVATAINSNAEDITTLQSTVQAQQSPPAGGLTVSVGGTFIGSLVSDNRSCEDMFGGLGGPIPAAYTCSGLTIPFYVTVLTSKGFIAIINNGTQLFNDFVLGTEGTLAAPSNVYFDAANCTGNKYIALAYAPPYYLRQGVVIGAIDPADANESYYVQGSMYNPTIVSYATAAMNTNGTLGTPTCSSGAGQSSGYLMYLLTANSTAITGVPMTPSGNIAITAH